METRTIAFLALGISIVVGILFYLHTMPTALGLPHGRTA